MGSLLVAVRDIRIGIPFEKQIAGPSLRDAHLAGTAIMTPSSSDIHGDVERCRALGGDVYGRKPIEGSDLPDPIRPVPGDSPAAMVEQAAPAPNSPIAPSRRLRVLLAEDAPVNQRLAVTLLESRGYEVAVAGDGREALEILDRETFDLVLMDVQMPRMDGFEATAAIRRGEVDTGRHLTILAMTAHAMDGDRERCLGAGMDGYISKPIRAQQFLAIVGGHAVPAAMAETGESGETRLEVAEQVFDLPDALARALGRPELLQKMSELFLADCPGLLDQVRAALAAGDGSALERAAHRIRGSAAYLSAPRVVEVAGRLEGMGSEGVLSEAGAACKELEDEVVRLEFALEILKEAGTA
ncbi:response regulator [Paludisphaera mucosa]|uniref:Response regulator n=1 Tax=Paludisphaera mucosa TaxID=3030827 RepID=A0ABT6FCZ6_9BACT|nr:response regulator [Paludisphaera mucosa]MDG3005454.1 response regulator [Paludisphaera mucosa]